MPVVRRAARAAALAVALAVAFAPGGTAGAADEIDTAIAKGSGFLKARYTGGPAGAGPVGEGHGVGGTCLAGLALLEAGTPPADPAVKAITQIVRGEAGKQSQTYQVSLCLMYLDRLGEPADVPMIQALAVRLLAGQTAGGGWSYAATAEIPDADAQQLRALKPTQQPGKLHPEIEKYGRALFAARAQSTVDGPDDNSNTQFAVMAVWIARKHGVPVDGALELVEKRFLATQNPRTGGWPYAGVRDGGAGSPSMHCAGLIGLATGVARREERRVKTEPPKEDPPAKAGPAPGTNPDDPFFNPPAKAEPKKPAPARGLDARDRSVQLAFAGLGAILAESARVGRGALFLQGGVHGQHDLYFFWSLERVGVIFGADKIGGVDWHTAGARTLLRAQNPDGSWKVSYGPEVDTSFAVLFLCRSNLARDLSSKVQKEVSTEMRAGAGPTGASPKPGVPGAPGDANPVVTNPILPGVGGSEAAVLAGELLRASEKDWPEVLKKLRDSKGPVYTKALAASVSRLDGERRSGARAALAERLTRMTASTLRALAREEDAELRRAAVLAMAMKDDRDHVPDLVAAILDEEEVVVRAARAGLKSLTGKDFGPAVNATLGEKKLAVSAWNEWLGKQKK
jgi:hypothetical protein